MSRNSREKRDHKRTLEIIKNTPSDTADLFLSENKPIKAITFSQKRFKNAIETDSQVIAIGGAGVGKTYLASMVAADLYLSKQYRQLILTTPTVECGESLGALPGELSEKFEPFISPFKKGLVSRLHNKYASDLNKNILPIPLQYMRGESFDDAIILADEMQNSTIQQMKMLITRIGYNCKLIITGDIGQIDLKDKRDSGLVWLVEEHRRQQTNIEIIEFDDKSECVRSDVCKANLKLIANATM